MDTDTNTLQKVLQAKEEALKDLKDSFEEYKKEAIEYERELEADNEYKEKEIEALHKKLEIAGKKLEEYKKEVNQSNRILEREKTRMDALGDELSTLKSRIVCLEQLNEDLESEIRNVKFEKQELIERLEGLEERFVLEKEDLEEQLNQKNADLERFRLDMHECEDEIVLWKRKSTFIEDKVGTPRLRQDSGVFLEMSRTLMLEEELAKYREEIDKLDDDLKERNREIQNYTGKLDRMQEEIGMLKEKLEMKDKQLEEAEIKLNEVKHENLELRQKLEESQSLVGHGKEDVSGEKIVISENIHTEEESQNTINLLKEEVRKIRGCLNEERSTKIRLESTISELNRELEIERAENSELKKQAKESKNDLNLRFEILASRNGGAKESPLNSPVEENIDSKDMSKEKEGFGFGDDAIRANQEGSENADDAITKLQEENKHLAEQCLKLEETIKSLRDRVSLGEEDRAQLEKEISARDEKIMRLQEREIELRQELFGEIMRQTNTMVEEGRHQQINLPLSKIDELCKSNLMDVCRSDLETTPTYNGNSDFKNYNSVATTHFDSGKIQAKGQKASLYVKASKRPLPSFVKIHEKSVIINERPEVLNVRGQEKERSKRYPVEAVYHNPSMINAQDILKCKMESLFDKNILLLIYGAKKTDKKQIRYKILEDLIGMCKSMSMKEALNKKICKVLIKIEDLSLLKKAQKNKSVFESLKDTREFAVEKDEKLLQDYLQIIKQLELGKDRKKDNKTKKEKTLDRQILLEFIIQNPEDCTLKTTRTEAKIKIALAVLNNEINENNEPPISLFLRNRAHKDGETFAEYEAKTEKFLLLTINPSSSSESFKAVSETLAVLGTSESAQKLEESFTRHFYQAQSVNSFNSSPEKIKEDEHTTQEEKPWLPRTLKDSDHAEANSENIRPSPDGYLSVNSTISVQSKEQQELAKKIRHYSKKSHFMQDNMSRLFGFMNNWKKCKQTKSVSTDFSNSMLSTKSLGYNGASNRKLFL